MESVISVISDAMIHCFIDIVFVVFAYVYLISFDILKLKYSIA